MRLLAVSLLLILLIFLSSLSGYELRPKGYVVNFPIITRLTPYGLFANLVFGVNDELRPFYFKVVARKTSVPMLTLVAGIMIIALYILRSSE